MEACVALLIMCTILRKYGQSITAVIVIEVSHSLVVRLTEMEASVCLPCLMEEVGGNNDNQRKLIRDLIKKATQVRRARHKRFNSLFRDFRHFRNLFLK